MRAACADKAAEAKGDDGMDKPLETPFLQVWPNWHRSGLVHASSSQQSCSAVSASTPTSAGAWQSFSTIATAKPSAVVSGRAMEIKRKRKTRKYFTRRLYKPCVPMFITQSRQATGNPARCSVPAFGNLHQYRELTAIPHCPAPEAMATTGFECLVQDRQNEDDRQQDPSGEPSPVAACAEYARAQACQNLVRHKLPRQ